MIDIKEIARKGCDFMKRLNKALILLLLLSIMSHSVFPGFIWASADQAGIRCRIEVNRSHLIVMQSSQTELITTQIRATVVPVDSCGQTLVYTSANTGIARVNSHGTVWGVQPGDTYITVSLAEDMSVSTRVGVNVRPYVGIGQGEAPPKENTPQWVGGSSPWDRPIRVDKEAREAARQIDWTTVNIVDKALDYMLIKKLVWNVGRELFWRTDEPWGVRLLNIVKEAGTAIIGAPATFIDQMMQVFVDEDWFATPYTYTMGEIDNIRQQLAQYANPTVSILGDREINNPEGVYTYKASTNPQSSDYLFIWKIGDSEYTGSSIDIDFSRYVSVVSRVADVPLSVSVKTSMDGDVLGSESTVIRINSVYPTILGEREIVYSLEEGDVVEHSFTAEPSHSGDYTYDWEFGDGRSWSQSPGAGVRSGGTVTYAYDNFEDSTTLHIRVRLKDRNNPTETYGSDSIVLNFILNGEDDEFEDREDSIEICNEWYESGSGGAGTTRTVYDISMLPVGTSFDMRFDAISIPDRFIVEYQGAEVFNSGWRGSASHAADKPDLYPGGVSGPGSGTVASMFVKNRENSFTVTVIGPESGTAWNYAIRANCFDMDQLDDIDLPIEDAGVIAVSWEMMMRKAEKERMTAHDLAY